MLPRRSSDPAVGRSALDEWMIGRTESPRRVIAVAVRFTLQELVARAPGRATEVRVPPFGVVQCVEGPRHTRGTPPNVVETDPDTWLRLACGLLDWDEAVGEGRVRASGTRSSLARYLPLVPLSDGAGPGAAS